MKAFVDSVVATVAEQLDLLSAEEHEEATLRITDLISSDVLEKRLELRKQELVQKDSHGLESFIPETTSDPEWDPQGPEDGGHPW